MHLVLKIIRSLQSLRRRIFQRGIPHYLRDFLRVFKILKLLRLLPTFLCSLAAPRHFYRRLPIILRGKKRIYQSPVGYFIGCFLLIVSMNYVDLYDQLLPLGSQPPTTEESIWFTNIQLLLVWIFCPFWILVLASCVFFIREAALALFGSEKRQYNVVIPLSLSSYRNLRTSRLVWGVFYLGPYFILVLPLALSYLGTYFLLAIDLLPPGTTVIWVLIVIAYPAMTLVDDCLIRPYSELLRGASKYPTYLQELGDTAGLRGALESFSSCDLDLPPEVLQNYGRHLALECESKIKELKIKDFDMRTLGPSEIEAAKDARSSAFATLPIDEALDSELLSRLTHAKSKALLALLLELRGERRGKSQKPLKTPLLRRKIWRL